MFMASKRPISPHLQVYKWGPHMLVSILHRASGDGLAILGSLLFLWWLGAIAGGEATYQAFLNIVWQAAPAGPPSAAPGAVPQAVATTVSLSVTNWIGRIILIGLTWAFFQHLFSGLRHFVLDTGAGYELKVNKLWSTLAIIAAVMATAAVWLFIFAKAVGGAGE
ncbi:MAG: succinate:quinone oxidoreductase subunit C [Sphingopyxis sp.]|nr:succinate:quinone oxidoreductase subunit C [Sphingopyxis sp.]